MNACRWNGLFCLAIAAQATAPSTSLAVLPYFVDFSAPQGIANTTPMFERTGFHGPTGFPGCGASNENCGVISDLIEINKPPLAAVLPATGLAYVDLQGGSIGLITTLYGVDLNPNGSDIIVGGFDPIQPELVFGEEMFTGISQNYLATPLGTISVGELSTRFPNFDLSPFSAAMLNDPSSVVWGIETTVDLSDFPTIPEPTAIFLLGTALLLASGYRARQSKA